MSFCEGRNASSLNHITNHKARTDNGLHVFLAHEMLRKYLKKKVSIEKPIDVRSPRDVHTEG